MRQTILNYAANVPMGFYYKNLNVSPHALMPGPSIVFARIALTPAASAPA